MGNVNVKNGTPVGTASLCDTCRNAHVMKGYRESEKLVFCTYPYEQIIQVPFVLYECTNYSDKTVPTRWEMEEIAHPIEPKSLKPATGFGPRIEDEKSEEGEETPAIVNRS